MVEIVSEDVMDWARDLAALRKLFADEPATDPHVNTQTIILQFSEYQQQQPMVNSAIEPIGNLVCSSLTSITAVKSGID